MQRNRVILQEVWRNKSVARTLLNLEVQSSVTLVERTVDLGAGKSPSYYRFLGHDHPPQNVIRVDLTPAALPSLIASLEDSLPFRDGSVNQVLLFNVLEHVYRHRQLLGEIARVLTKGGRLCLWVPFLAQIHPDPVDYFRYTHSALATLLDEADFGQHEIRPHAGLFLVLSGFVNAVLPLRLLRMLAAALALAADGLLSRLAPNYSSRFVVGYFVSARK